MSTPLDSEVVVTADSVEIKANAIRITSRKFCATAKLKKVYQLALTSNGSNLIVRYTTKYGTRYQGIENVRSRIDVSLIFCDVCCNLCKVITYFFDEVCD